jgi:hypothetical protein
MLPGICTYPGCVGIYPWLASNWFILVALPPRPLSATLTCPWPYSQIIQGVSTHGRRDAVDLDIHLQVGEGGKQSSSEVQATPHGLVTAIPGQPVPCCLRLP